MTVKLTAQQQHQKLIDEQQNRFSKLADPPEGWLKTVRKALGMSGAELSRKLGVSRSQTAKTEQNELDGRVTLKTMQTMAHAMGCKFVYAIMPAEGQTIDEIIFAQALIKARGIAGRTHEHMALENQGLFKADLDRQIENLAERLVVQMPADFWTDN